MRNKENILERVPDSFAVYLDQYDWPSAYRVEMEESGMNNTTRMVYCGHERYVLRVYDNHKDHAKVQLEHTVLRELAKQKASILIPVPVMNRSGHTVTAAPDGKLAALYRYIEGKRPMPALDQHVAGLGQASGRLVDALSRLSIHLTPVYSAYYELGDNYGYLTEDKLEAALLNSSSLQQLQPIRKRLSVERTHLIRSYDRLKAMPHQWIHGDIVFTNAIAQGERVIGLLDFEFCTRDLRAMELAVVLPEFIHEDLEQTLHKMELFIAGYGIHAKLTGPELELLPDLIKLRMLDVYLHFAGRLLEGLDDAAVWEGQIKRAAYVCDWVNQHRERLGRLFQVHLLGG
ncbi:phosphotransferase [Paenibacillus abyssi]|uniref:Aminoglycoside phosphotransferase domain-containing protein n=1 Tax=Paenibacillus abyssi TaxID=1340531 RepID=A0A917CJP5_9BACL|nr:phosphotransferase [Paenibacillus abyssi]GGF90147.1 hypothetical protein GCM10010916_04400 [Paenibacillus abyssi]